ncbi:putative cytochrome P450 oxidoreductase [Sphaerosporella brunnea]|uniref:Putative cytochrome P450 oxidoreductase n=1 Tax=Sphaerosporella brunnea TaxID=1250544 RepID=A0A5J5F1R1_9PEZI|nr:putative cytochrome P450 oxidoreductase [Sphaerosporella brunnea]
MAGYYPDRIVSEPLTWKEKDSGFLAGFIRTHALTVLATLFLLLLLLLLLRNKFRRGLFSLPGPTRLYDVWKGQAHLTHIRLHQKHGALTDADVHRERKRLHGHTHNLSSLLKMETAIDACTSQLLETLRKCSLVFGKKLGFFEEARDVDGMMRHIQGVLVYASHCGQIPEAHPLLLGNPLFPVLIPAMETWNALKTINEVREGLTLRRDGGLQIQEKLEGKKDMMSRLSRLKEEDPEQYNTRDIIIHTTELKSANKKQKLVAEIDRKDAAEKLSHLIIYGEATEELPYLQAVMRLHPSVGLMLERYVPPEGVTIASHFMPAGTIVGVNTWVMHRNPAIFPSPEEFRPERWSESTPAQLKVMAQTMFQFGAGSRIWLGRWMSLIEMSKVVPQIFREFDVELADPEKEWSVRNVWFVQQSGVICRLAHRT